MSCDICKLIENKDKFRVIYEDDISLAVLHESPANPGHVLLMPKEHYAILEEVPDDIIQKLYNVANQVSIALFENLGGGTNILVNNGSDAGQALPHFIINIIPRKEGDSLKFDWPMQQASEDDLSTAMLMLKDQTDKIHFEKPKPKPVVMDTDEKVEKSSEEDYQIKNLRRTP